ncbi:MAG: outer membrane protein assembly factor BamE [Gammaproteobacteria bacterium]|nr:outer membrane protein assembly factor BamE [Gammaproteobacteria bacterium]
MLYGCARNDLPRPADMPSFSSLPFVHKIDIQQGNVVTQEMIAQLKLGMDKKKVNFIMGSPIILDAFHSGRWDYLYTSQEGRGRTKRRRVTLYFDGDQLTRVEGDVKPAEGRLVVDTRQDTTVDVPNVHREGLIAKLKESIPFVGNDAPEKQRKLAKTTPADTAVTSEPTPDEAAPSGPVMTPIERAALEEQGGPGVMAKLKAAIPFTNDTETEPALDGVEATKSERPTKLEATADSALTPSEIVESTSDESDQPGLLAKIKDALPFTQDTEADAGKEVDTVFDTSDEVRETADEHAWADEEEPYVEAPSVVPTSIPLGEPLDTGERNSDDDLANPRAALRDNEKEVVVPKSGRSKKRGFFARLFGLDRDDDTAPEPDQREQRRYRELSEPDSE